MSPDWDASLMGGGHGIRKIYGAKMKHLLSKAMIAACVIGGATRAFADPSEADAIAYAEKAFVGKVAVCGSRTYILTHDDTLTEINNPHYYVTRTPLSTADRLNGLDFQGKVRLVADAFRWFDVKATAWEDWQDKDSHFSAYSALDAMAENDPRMAKGGGAPLTPAGFVSIIEHKNGKWQTPLTTLDQVSKLDCTLAASIQAGKLQGQPFIPNAVLRRPYIWSNNCRVPQGTRVMDLGRDKDFESVVVDPAVCAPKPGFATGAPSLLPPDAIEKSQEGSSIGAKDPLTSTDAVQAPAAPIPSGQPGLAEPSRDEITRPFQTPSPVDSSRASLSHSPTRTFYTATAVPVYVHGYDRRGGVLCTVPAGRPVPARIQNRPPQFRGDYGVLAYKADLCPNAASTQPRDMYHEFFFRAIAAR